MAILERPGLTLHYEEAGEGPTVLFTHGFGATAAMFAPTLPALTDAYRVVTWDLPGHGASGSPAEAARYATDEVVGDLGALLDSVGASSAVLVGHSVGGFLSLRFATSHPQRVTALVLVGTGPGYRSEAGRASWNAFAERYASALERRGLDALETSAELVPDAHRDASGLARAARGFLVQRDRVVSDALSDLTIPALVVVGSDDEAFVPAARHMAATMRAAELLMIEGGGHTPNLLRPEAFNASLRRFVDRVAGLS